MLDRTCPPRQYAVSRVDFQQVISDELQGGIPFHHLICGDQPVVKLEILFPHGGAWSEPKRGVSFLSLNMLREGTHSYSSGQISDTLSGHGAFLDVNPGFDHTSISLYCLDRHVQKLLPVLFEIVASPSFDEKELRLQKEQQIAQLRIRNRKNNVVASKRLRSQLFGEEHPYGRVLNEDDISEISSHDLRLFHDHQKKNIQLFLSGNPSKESFAAIRSQFEHWELADDHEGALHLLTSAEASNNSDSSIQASVRIGRETLHKTHEDYISLRVTNHLLGGFFGSRLMKNIREDKGLTYGINSGLVQLKHASYWMIGAEVNARLVDQAIAEIRKEVEALAGFNDEDELETAKTHLMGSFQSEINSPFQLVEKFKNIWLHGLGYDYYDRYFTTIEEFDGEKLRNTASKYLSTTDWTEVVVT